MANLDLSKTLLMKTGELCSSSEFKNLLSAQSVYSNKFAQVQTYLNVIFLTLGAQTIVQLMALYPEDIKDEVQSYMRESGLKDSVINGLQNLIQNILQKNDVNPELFRFGSQIAQSDFLLNKPSKDELLEFINKEIAHGELKNLRFLPPSRHEKDFQNNTVTRKPKTQSSVSQDNKKPQSKKNLGPLNSLQKTTFIKPTQIPRKRVKKALSKNGAEVDLFFLPKEQALQYMFCKYATLPENEDDLLFSMNFNGSDKRFPTPKGKKLFKKLKNKFNHVCKIHNFSHLWQLAVLNKEQLQMTKIGDHIKTALIDHGLDPSSLSDVKEKIKFRPREDHHVHVFPEDADEANKAFTKFLFENEDIDEPTIERMLDEKSIGRNRKNLKNYSLEYNIGL